MKTSRACIALLLACAALPASAGGLDQLQNLSQTDFRALSEDLGAALSYKPLVPTAPLGFPGFDVSVAATATKLKHQDLLQRASSSGSDFPATVVVPSVRASVGLPLNLDASMMYSSVPKTSARLWGGALAYAYVPDNSALAVGLRGSYTRADGIEQLDFSTAGLDASLSWRIAFITPYAGGGRVWIKSSPVIATGLHNESLSLNKGYAGLSFKLTVVHLDLEYDRTGLANSYGAKLGLRF